MRTLQLALFLALGSLLSLNAAEGSIKLGIHVRHTHQGHPLQIDSLKYKTPKQEFYSVRRLSYLLSDFQLQDSSGTWTFPKERFAYVDVEKKRDSFVLTNIPAGNYRALRFHVGIDPETNHGDPSQYPADHPLNPNFNQLHWDWKTGYIFLALEGHHRMDDGTLSGYVYHIANAPQRTQITLSLPQDIHATSALEIDFDLAVLLNSPRPISFSEDGASTHSQSGDPLVQTLTTNLRGAFQVQKMVTFTRSTEGEILSPIDLPKHYTPHPFKMNKRFPMPNLPGDNPLITERILLGERLFHEERLSATNTISCASCHKQKHALSDNRTRSIGVYDQKSRRHSMPLFNLAWKKEFFWDGRSPSLRDQVLHPIQDPLEMGERLPQVIEKLSKDQNYKEQFEAAFQSGLITEQNIALALESFLLSLTSYASPFDATVAGDNMLTPQEQRGLELFMTEFEPRSKQYGADCFHCHGGALFSDHRFHDNGLPSRNGDKGRGDITGVSGDDHHFSTPSLRNIAHTAPYMHDGRFKTLEEVIEHYSSGIVQRETLDPNLAKHPEGGLHLNEEDKASLVAFLKTLSDPVYDQ